MRRDAPDVVLAVDLDGTLLHTDTLAESVIFLLRHHPAKFLAALYWLMCGRLRLKQEVAALVCLPPEHLPYNSALLEYVRQEHSRGRRTVLATAAHQTVAEAVARYLGCFDLVLATTADKNLKGNAKREELVRLFGKGNFDYVGDSPADIPVWQSSRVAHAAGRMKRVPSAALAEGALPGPTFPRPATSAGDVLRALRVQQWVKNLLIFAPALLNHFINPAILQMLGLAFLSFSLTASGTYIVNDLFDMDADRRHHRKRHRPIASAALSIRLGAAIALVCFAVGIGLGAHIGRGFLACLVFYGLLTVFYSIFLKNKPVIDVVALAVFYTIRLYAGGLAASSWISPWLIQFSVFLFLSLAFVKRYSELFRLEKSVDSIARGYRVGDLEIISQAGVASGFIAGLVLALYVNAPETRLLYHRPEFLWGLCPIFIYWITRAWLVAHRGNMDDDPLVFAFHDHVSYIAGILMVGCILLAWLPKVGI